MAELSAFKSYDVRGRLGHEVDQALAYKIGRAFAALMEPGTVVTGRDARESSPGLQTALIQGLRDSGVDVVDIGLCGTEEMYFATDHFGAGGGIMVTASHNPADHNGFKLVGPQARPLAPPRGIKALRDLVARGNFGPVQPLGGYRRENPRYSYADRVVSFLDPASLNPSQLKPLHILVNAGNGVAGPAFDEIAERLEIIGAPFSFTRLHHEPDSRFPNGVPNPILPENQPETAEAVVAHGADLGVAWDGDFDRCFFFDETGNFIDSAYVVALLARSYLLRYPQSCIVHDTRVQWNTEAEILAGGGTPVPAQSGHSHMKAAMRQANAIYGGEVSAHHYFRNFMFCDSGMIPWLLVAEVMSRSGKPLSALVADMQARFPASGEINFAPADIPAALARLEAHYLPQAQGVDRIDGASFDLGEWRLNIRASHTEAVLRVNIETRGNSSLLNEKIAEVTALLSV